VEAELQVLLVRRQLNVQKALLDVIQLDFVLHLVEEVVEELMTFPLALLSLTENQVVLAEVQLLIVDVVEQVWPVKEMMEAINQ
tara:strand:- start:205 stop:456 length:252 start_codon:yes stop_codon:yes gene_type:complete